jgi:hypothetical protein
MAKEKSLDLAAVQTWLAAWKEKDLYSDAAVRDLLSLIPDNYCMVVVTCGVGCVLPNPTIKARVQPQILDPDRVTMFHGPTPPMAPTTGHLWLKEGVTPKWSVPWVTQKIFRWDGRQWLLHGHLRDEASISRQGKQECSFAEALAGARETARRNRLQTIYTFDDSTWGNA